MAPGGETMQPPSIAFTSFRSAIQSLRDHGLPATLDRTAWNSRSGTEQSQIVASLKFFGLTDDKGTTQEALKELVAIQENTDAEKEAWAKLLRQRYAAAFKVDLANATPKQLEDAIGDLGVVGLTKQRAIRFFLKAAMHAKIPLSSRLTVNLRERSSPSESATENGSAEGGAQPKTPKVRRNKRRTSQPPTPPPTSPETQATGNAMKTIQLPNVGGSLSIQGTFNAFQLMDDERELVYKIIDLMTDYERKAGDGE